MTDLRYAIRVLLRTPTLTALAIVSLALGIGANVTIYTIANAFLNQPISGAHDGYAVRTEMGACPFPTAWRADCRD